MTLISIVIPTYEEQNIYTTLKRLIEQSVFTLYPKEVEIIIADYVPYGSKCFVTFNEYKRFVNDFPHIDCKIVGVDRKGIAYARHVGIQNSSGKIIVNFDADCYYNSRYGIELSTNPLLEPNSKYVITCCDNVLDSEDWKDKQLSKEILLGITAYNTLNMIQRDALIVCLEPGMCFTRNAYDYSAGFNDIKQYEAIFLSPRIIYNFGLLSKKHIPDVSVIVSARRFLGMSKVGLLNALDYDNIFRKGLNVQ